MVWLRQHVASLPIILPYFLGGVPQGGGNHHRRKRRHRTIFSQKSSLSNWSCLREDPLPRRALQGGAGPEGRPQRGESG
ncbi:hypothetical protein CEXT_316761, partial [Caerostris extrusa]